MPGSQPSPAAVPADTGARRFELYRRQDVSGVSGTGVVAYGTAFPTGWVAICWPSTHPCVTVWPSVQDAIAIHGHGGATVVRWIDPPVGRDPAVARRRLLADLAGELDPDPSDPTEPPGPRFGAIHVIGALILVAVMAATLIGTS